MIKEKAMVDAVFAQDVGEMKVMSMDVKALYPSLRIREVSPILKELLVTAQEEGKFTMESIDWKEIGNSWPSP